MLSREASGSLLASPIGEAWCVSGVACANDPRPPVTTVGDVFADLPSTTSANVVVQIRAEITRRKILDAAVDLFTERGFGETGMIDVLKHAEVSKGAFYYHFESKTALAEAIIDEGGARIINAFRAITASSPALESLIRATFVIGHDRPRQGGSHGKSAQAGIEPGQRDRRQHIPATHSGGRRCGPESCSCW